MLVGMPLLRIFDRMGCGGMVLSTSGRVLALNEGARRILGQMFHLTKAELDELNGSGRDVAKRLLSRGRTRIQLDNENWILIEREGQRPIIINAVPVPVLSDEGPHTVLVLIDLDDSPLPKQTTLERVFGLTPAEARLATLLARGATTSEAAEALGISVATVRTQLGSIFGKTHTHRQAELVILLARLSALP
jgi:DNA-binding CsgD family transcriptional regulator